MGIRACARPETPRKIPSNFRPAHFVVDRCLGYSILIRRKVDCAICNPLVQSSFSETYMPIRTDFTFGHQISRIAAHAAVPSDLLGLLRGLVGTDPPQNSFRKWTGKGFNMIWRPNHGGQSGPQDFFLELNFTEEVLEFADITSPGPNGIANRGLLQNDVPLGGVAYMETIRDSFDQSGQHFELGLWANLPATTNPNEPATIVRMGSIPHGTTINLQGRAFSAPEPDFDVASIQPFPIDHPEQPLNFPDQDLSRPSQSRTPLNRVTSLTQPQLNNPNLFLSEAISHQTILETTVLTVTSDTSAPGSIPNAGGGTPSIAFLTGVGAPPAGGSNASVALAEAMFWIERVKGENGSPNFNQLQYAQRVLLTLTS
jgi:hypothetical protein